MSFFNPIRKFYMADETVGLKITADTADATKNVKSLRQQIQDATQDVVKMNEQFGSTSTEAANAAKKLAELKDQFADAKSLSDAFNPDRKFQAFSGALQSVTGGFSALTGAMALFGVESEDVQKTLLKVQAALAISEGVNSVLDGVQAFKNLGAVIQQSTLFLKANAVTTAIASTAMKVFGISVDTTATSFKVLKTVIASTGIGLLIVALGSLVAAFNSSADAADNATEAQKRFVDNTENAAKAALNAGIKFNEQQAALEIARAKAKGATDEEIFNIQQKWDKEKLAAKQRYYDDAGFIDKDAADEVTNQAAQNEIADLNHQASVNDKKLKQNQAYNDQKKKDNEQALKEQEAADEDFRQRSNQVAVDGMKFINDEATRREQAKAAQVQQDADDQAARDAYYENIANTEFQAAQTSIETAQNAANQKMAIEQTEFDNKQKLAQASIGILNTLSSVVGQQTVAGKALAIAAATIDTYAAAVAILKNTARNPITGALPGFAVAQMIATIAAGMLTVGKIAAVKVPGGGGGGGAIPSINTTAPLTPQAPVVRTNTSLDQNSINQLGQASNKTYVLETDVTNNQQRIAMLNRQARIG